MSLLTHRCRYWPYATQGQNLEDCVSGELINDVRSLEETLYMADPKSLLQVRSFCPTPILT
jgi:hypothetical protein